MPTARQLEFESLIAPHLSSLYSTALRMTHNQNDAEDLVQDTLYKAFRAFDQYQKNTNFRAWAFRILVNTYITAYRKALGEKISALPCVSNTSTHVVMEAVKE